MSQIASGGVDEAVTPSSFSTHNHQLVYTGQYTQHACPLSGEAITDSSPEFEVDGGSLGAVTVRVSSQEIEDQLAAMELGDQIKSVFVPEGFEKGKFSAEQSAYREKTIKRKQGTAASCLLLFYLSRLIFNIKNDVGKVRA